MAIFAFHPINEADRRADGIGFILAEGTDEAAARSAAARLIGAPGIEAWAGVSVTTGIDALAVQGLPVGAPDNVTWPTCTRANRKLNS